MTTKNGNGLALIVFGLLGINADEATVDTSSLLSNFSDVAPHGTSVKLTSVVSRTTTSVDSLSAGHLAGDGGFSSASAVRPDEWATRGAPLKTDEGSEASAAALRPSLPPVQPRQLVNGTHGVALAHRRLQATCGAGTGYTMPVPDFGGVGASPPPPRVDRFHRVGAP